MHKFLLKKGNDPLLGMVALCIWQQIPILAGPLLKANCPIFRHPLPHCPSSRQHSISIHTDDFNMAESSSFSTVPMIGRYWIQGAKFKIGHFLSVSFLRESILK
jgi:hypothetical protein